MSVYYNENNPEMVRWLKQLIIDGQLPRGDVDDRSILDVQASDIRHYRQRHFFAGIGGWALAAQLAGWPKDREFNSGSCPCQPFSVAGNKQRTNDKRDLWPHFRTLICEIGATPTFGEQVTEGIGEDWLSRAHLDMERESYQFWACSLTAHAVGAPIERQRHYWIAEQLEQSERVRGEARRTERNARRRHIALDGADEQSGVERSGSNIQSDQWDRHNSINRTDAMCRFRRSEFDIPRRAKDTDEKQVPHEHRQTSNDRNFWHDAEWLWCEWDQKWRRTKSGIPMLVDRFPGRMDIIGGYGNAICPPLAAEILKAYLDIRPT